MSLCTVLSCRRKKDHRGPHLDAFGKRWVRTTNTPDRKSPRVPGPDYDIIHRLLLAIGEDPTRAGLRDTPRRVAESWRELYGGYNVNVEKLFTLFEEGHDEMVILRDIEFYSTCEHHMLQFAGVAHVGYLPGALAGNAESTYQIIGVSKLARVVDAYARRLQTQERIGAQVAEAIVEYAGASGAGCVIEAKHSCMTCRGVGKQHSKMITSSLRGCFRDDKEVRAEFMSLLGL